MPPDNIVEITSKIKANMMIDSYEPHGRAVISESSFLPDLKSYNKDGINDEHIELLEPYSREEEWFNDKVAAGVSKAAAGLLKWVLAMALFYSKSKIVKPKII